MKKLLPILIAVYLTAATAIASDSRLIFWAPAHQKIEVVLDGVKVNRYPAKSVYVNHVRPGKHFVKIIVIGRRFNREVREQVLLKPFAEYQYYLGTDRHGFLVLHGTNHKSHYNGNHVGNSYYSYPSTSYDNYRFHKPTYNNYSYYGVSGRHDYYTWDQKWFQNMVQEINSSQWDDDKLILAKRVVRDNRISSSQIREIMVLFNFESTRLKFAKFAYHYALDKENYYQVKMALKFESSRMDLYDYIYHQG